MFVVCPPDCSAFSLPHFYFQLPLCEIPPWLTSLRFLVPECRSYRFAAEDEADRERDGINRDTGDKQDFGPSLLLPVSPLCLAGTNDEEGNADGE